MQTVNPFSAFRKVSRALTTAAWGPVPLDLPKLRVYRSVDTPQCFAFLCPDEPKPSGGVRKIYRHVDILSAAGCDAYVLHHRHPFSCDWFDHSTPIRWADRDALASTGTLVVPEIYAVNASKVPPTLKKVLLCQNPFYLISGAPLDDAYKTREMLARGDFAYAVSVSEYASDILRLVLPEIETRRVIYGIDDNLFRDRGQRTHEILYMPRKRRRELRDLFVLLGGRIQEGWKLVPLDGLDEGTVAERMGRAGVFISTSDREGFGLPPAEAMLSGCIVVGFDGLGGREFMKSMNPFTVDEGDVVGLARTLQHVLASWEQTDGWRDQRQSSTEFIREEYSMRREAASVLHSYS